MAANTASGTSRSTRTATVSRNCVASAPSATIVRSLLMKRRTGSSSRCSPAIRSRTPSLANRLTDYTKDIQRIKTNLMRAILDSAAESINPKTVINELLVNPDDAMNDDLGAVIRTRGDPGATVMFTNTPFLGQAMTPVVRASERRSCAANGPH